MESFNHLIQTFGEQHNTQNIKADDQGYVALLFDSQLLHLQYDEEHEEIVVFTKLAEIDPDRMGDICIMLLSANLFWQGSQGATFSVEPATGIAFLAERQHLSMVNVHRLNIWLERFLNIVSYWHKRLSVANKGGSLKPDYQIQ